MRNKKSHLHEICPQQNGNGKTSITSRTTRNFEMELNVCFNSFLLKCKWVSAKICYVGGGNSFFNYHVIQKILPPALNCSTFAHMFGKIPTHFLVVLWSIFLGLFTFKTCLLMFLTAITIFGNCNPANLRGKNILEQSFNWFWMLSMSNLNLWKTNSFYLFLICPNCETNRNYFNIKLSHIILYNII